MKISARLAFQSSIIVFGVTILLLLFINSQLKEFAIQIAEEKADMLLQEKQATISYVTNDLRPSLLKLVKKHQVPDSYFDPSWMSAGYVNRKIMSYFAKSKFSEFYYKNAAINARSPQNEAEGYEADFLKRVREDSSLSHFSTIKRINDEPFLILMRPNTSIFNESCMKCHSQPEKAPADLLKLYGTERSFNKQIGQIPSVLSLRIPMGEVYAQIDSLTISILLSIFCFSGIVFLLNWLITNKLVVSPLQKITNTAVAIKNDESLLGAPITSDGKAEFKELGDSLSDLSHKLATSRDSLEEEVRKKTNELKKAKEELQNIFDKILEGFAVHEMLFDEQGNPIDYVFLKVNPSFEELTGLKSEDIVGKRLLEVLPDAELKWIHTYGEVVTTGAPVHFKNYSKELEKYLEINAFKVEENQFATLFRDITDIVQAEKEKKDLERIVTQSQKLESLGTLAGGIAHDFNNMLGVILGYAGMAKDDAPANSKHMEDLEKIITAGNRAKDLVKQILAFSRKSEVERYPLKIQQLLKEAIKLLRASIPSTIEIQAAIDEECGTVLADPTQLHQIIMNLCTNANHAMEESGGILRIELKSIEIGKAHSLAETSLSPGQYVELIVSDTGKGIAPDVIDNIFDPYFTTKEPGRGTGMGLAIIHGIISNYGGTITVKNKLEVGASFHVFFPVLEIDVKKFYKESREALPTGQGKILFVDDEKVLADVGKEMLERLGYQVTAKTCSMDALSAFQNSPDQFDAVITDQTMPEMTGADLAKRILEIRPDIPVILCTGYSNMINDKTAKSIGIREFVFKPLSNNTIANLLQKVLGADRPESSYYSGN